MSCETYNSYDQGDTVTVRSNTFTNKDTGNPVDPDVVNVSVKTPAGVLTTYTHGTHPVVVRTGIGKYELAIDANEAGFWTYRWFSTGTGKAAAEARFYVAAAKAV